MAFEWNVYGALRIGAALVAFALASLVYFARPDRPQNRILGLALFVEALAFVGPGLLFLSDDPRFAYAALRLWIYLFPVTMCLYVMFLGTLDTPLRPVLRSWIFRSLAVAATAFAVILVMARPHLFSTGVSHVWFAEWEVVFTPHLGTLTNIGSLVSLVSLVVTVWAWRRTPRDSPARRSNGMIALAFVARDVVIVALMVEVYYRVNFLPLGQSHGWDRFHLIVWPLGLTLFYALLAYGILRAQVFDIDLKLKVGLRRSFVATPIAIGFFVASETLEGLLPIDKYWTGLLVAGAVTLAIVPLHRGAGRLADRLMPGVQDTASYRHDRAAEIYRAAWEAAQQDGKVTPREQAMLDRLAHEFGLPASATRRIVALEGGHGKR